MNSPIRFIIWGLQLHEDTHSYIHYGYHKAALTMGWNTEWLSDTPENQQRFSSTDGYLFMTAGHSCTHIPINPNAYYILHNCDMEQFTSIPLQHKLVLQVYTKDIHTRNVVELKENSYEYWDVTENVLYMPWATDLCPDEINHNIKRVERGEIGKEYPSAIFLGTVWDGLFGNINELNRCKESFQSHGIELIFEKCHDQTRSIEMIQQHQFAPTIVGNWQKDKGYIPCRIFKMISYGQMGITNSKEAYEVVGKHALYDSNEYELIQRAIILQKTNCIEQQTDAMKYVRDHHTYINRLQTIQTIFEKKCV